MDRRDFTWIDRLNSGSLVVQKRNYWNQAHWKKKRLCASTEVSMCKDTKASLTFVITIIINYRLSLICILSETRGLDDIFY